MIFACNTQKITLNIYYTWNSISFSYYLLDKKLRICLYNDCFIFKLFLLGNDSTLFVFSLIRWRIIFVLLKFIDLIIFLRDIFFWIFFLKFQKPSISIIHIDTGHTFKKIFIIKNDIFMFFLLFFRSVLLGWGKRWRWLHLNYPCLGNLWHFSLF